MSKIKLLSVAALLSTTVFAPVQAADTVDDKRWYIAPFGTYLNTDGDRSAKDGWGGGMGFGKMLDKHFNVEIRGLYQDFNGSQGLWSVTGGTVDLQYYFFREKLSPYTVIALGGSNNCLASNCTGGFLGEAGAGLSYELHDNFLLRSDIRYRYSNNNETNLNGSGSEFADFTVNVGFVIPFGDKPKSSSLKIAATEPVAVPAAVKSTDCSTLDSDHDGVNNCIDKCPDTPKGSKVDAQGCPIRLILKGSHFKYDSAELTIEAKTLLDQVVQSLVAYPQKNDIEVQGHTSSEGNDAYNLKLSQKRANSVVSYLKQKGVSNRLLAKGFGETKPIADNKTEAGRSENRRVELIWIEN